MINWNERQEIKELYESRIFEINVENLTKICKYIQEPIIQDFVPRDYWLYKTGYSMRNKRKWNSEKNNEKLNEMITDAMLDYCFFELRPLGNVRFDGFNYKHMDMLYRAVNYAKKHRIQDKFPIPITEGEWKKIREIENEEIQRLLFVMLVISKYFHKLKILNKWNYARDYRVDMEDSKIRKLAKVKLHRRNEDSKSNYRDFLLKKGYIAISERNQIYVLFAEKEGKVIETITDYDNLNLHFEKMCGKVLDTCQKCGRLYIQNRQNNAKYCPECRKYQHQSLKECQCVDCGNTFLKNPMQKRKIRCDICSDIHKKKLHRIRSQKYRRAVNSE